MFSFDELMKSCIRFLVFYAVALIISYIIVFKFL